MIEDWTVPLVRDAAPSLIDDGGFYSVRRLLRWVTRYYTIRNLLREDQQAMIGQSGPEVITPEGWKSWLPPEMGFQKSLGGFKMQGG